MEASTFIRFEDDNGTIRYGEPTKESLAGDLIGATVEVLQGDPFQGLKRSGEKAKVGVVLCPLESTPIVLCIGLNYKKHAEEANLTIAPYPVVFTKPPTALAGPYDDIHVHPDAASMMDYEGELVVVIGRDAKNVSVANALHYVLGYTMGNDVSARNFQLPDVSGGQFCYAKSFDGFAPMGPAIATTKAVSDPQALTYSTRVNGATRQETSTSDMIWTVAQIISHLSRGTTLRKGTTIMTGTPSGE
ncbi:fumarylacetoacetate hydrolase family protein [Emericellopsis atlantica]|uniref:Fumarylacetoacetate hydrolase family protein n=1 Tax=Emericellopsis atlantica TaxID=2614577 RepID=A0A9P7ZRL3_9HYPO|nr:fumarylacetoacetate hydrolase family protein [Emericellopsis atlantica]KAG9256517.1 fumarylacetoacetate hydrolase family protein [Emericellopsis atlantica]